MSEKSGISEPDQSKEMHAREIRRNFVLKAVCLVVLTIVTTITVVLLRLSRNVPSEERYISSTAIVISEVVKVVACLVGLFHSNDFSIARSWTVLYSEVIINWKETSKLFFPSFLYIIQNNLLFHALSHLNAATYQVTYQLKILTTAVFSYYILEKKLHKLQWFSLVVLMVGVALVQLDPDSISTEAKHPGSSTVVGLICVVLASLSSGLAGVYFEKLIKANVGKQASTGLTIRNLQMGIASIFFGALACIYNDFDDIRYRGFFVGYNLLTWIVIMLQAFGGLVVAMTIKYADNILKGFATSFSIILSSVSSYFFLGDLTLTVLFVTGTVLVIAATFLYGVRSSAPPVPRVETPMAKKNNSSVRFSCWNGFVVA